MGDSCRVVLNVPRAYPVIVFIYPRRVVLNVLRVNPVLVLLSDGPILVHTTFGDLLRSLDSPSGLTSPQNLALSREGVVVAHFPGGHVVAYTANGNRLRHEAHNDKIHVRIIAKCGHYTVNSAYYVILGDQYRTLCADHCRDINYWSVLVLY